MTSLRSALLIVLALALAPVVGIGLGSEALALH